MRLIGYIDGQRRFVRDEIALHEVESIAAHINELTDFHKKRLVLFIEHKGITHMIRTMGEIKCLNF